MDNRLALVTGAPGWLGTRFVQCLRDGIDGAPPFSDRIRCLVPPFIDPAPLRGIDPGIDVIAGDLRNASSLTAFVHGSEGATAFHLAGIVHPRRVRDLYAVNTEGTRNVLEACVRVGVRRFVAISSNSPAGCNTSPSDLFTEDAPYRPYLHYGRSKMLMEQAVRAAGDQGLIEAVILRPCWFYGPGQPPRQTLFFRMIRDGKAPVLGDGENRRSMSYIDNTCQAILRAGTSAAARNRTYWVADERPYTMNEILATVERLLEQEFGLPVRHGRRRLPGAVSRIAFGVDWCLQAAGLYHQKIHVLSEMNKTIACSVERARRELGYAPAISLEEGMRRSLHWCLAQGLPL